MSRLWMISYDIEDDKFRRRVHDVLKDHGERVQFSVFECWLDRPGLVELRTRLQAETQDQDSIRWYPLCRWCSRSIESQGQGGRAEDADYHLI